MNSDSMPLEEFVEAVRFWVYPDTLLAIIYTVIAVMDASSSLDKLVWVVALLYYLNAIVLYYVTSPGVAATLSPAMLNFNTAINVIALAAVTAYNGIEIAEGKQGTFLVALIGFLFKGSMCVIMNQFANRVTKENGTDDLSAPLTEP
mmetsp:Transcript_12034/g.18126  ORF Transcript_12034/g.18126 Transcript_12034/m.18126 type:complete len:147 (+) Transcript_12034:1-441(+)|eukprot:CAMPEP_0172615138 /NCGR_PEP_ID=MMETSP1068-20121228/55857_1 /TAXON_ID=35684 /ORGANISM="Pseudopedinella elastica, Strain CCMP716" /LENGTH=146 /DNA_ID=CAMNT_0013420171 /DNA_START=200 /DNA_END=640 /DNA_ORIENTATION=+